MARYGRSWARWRSIGPQDWHDHLKVEEKLKLKEGEYVCKVEGVFRSPPAEDEDNAVMKGWTEYLKVKTTKENEWGPYGDEGTTVGRLNRFNESPKEDRAVLSHLSGFEIDGNKRLHFHWTVY